jgi:hypothetical protein
LFSDFGFGSSNLNYRQEFVVSNLTMWENRVQIEAVPVIDIPWSYLAGIPKLMKVDLKALKIVVVISLLCFLVGGIGCKGGGPTGSRDPEADHLDKVGTLMSEYRAEHKGNAPGKLDDLKKWAVDNGKAQDSDFVSTRDKEPYVLKTFGSRSGGQAMVMILEATGKNSTKFVVMSSSQKSSPAEEMSDSRLNYSMGGGPPSIGGEAGPPKGGFPMMKKEK